MSRDRIDWENLQPLPRRAREKPDVEAHAERKFHRNKAKHKGRPHFYAHQRRSMRKAAEDGGRKTKAIIDAKFASLKARIRAYWNGDIDEHP